MTGIRVSTISLGKGDEVSLAKCMEVPESCSAGVDETCERASTIKTEVLAELNATRKRLHRIASDFVGCNTLTSQVSSYRSTFRAKVKSHTSCRKQLQTENDVSMACAKFLKSMKVNRTLLCERESLTADIADLMPICAPSAKETLGMWLENDGSVVLLDSSSLCSGNSTVANSSRAAVSKSLLEPRGSVDRRDNIFNPETS